MKRVSVLASASVTSILAVSAIAVPAYAWHPKGTIVKYVTNQTAGTTKSDANTDATAVSVAPGDVVLYTIVVSNTGAASSDGLNDMASTMLTDTLPAGIELVSNPATRTISENLGTITPGNSATKTYAVKVTSETDGDSITNKACFTGNSTVNDNPQSGCDVAIIKVHVPKKPPVTPPTPEQPQPVVLPDTGSTALTSAAAVGIAGILGFAFNTLRLKRRS